MKEWWFWIELSFARLLGWLGSSCLVVSYPFKFLEYLCLVHRVMAEHLVKYGLEGIGRERQRNQDRERAGEVRTENINNREVSEEPDNDVSWRAGFRRARAKEDIPNFKLWASGYSLLFTFLPPPQEQLYTPRKSKPVLLHPLLKAFHDADYFSHPSWPTWEGVGCSLRTCFLPFWNYRTPVSPGNARASRLKGASTLSVQRMCAPRTSFSAFHGFPREPLTFPAGFQRMWWFSYNDSSSPECNLLNDTAKFNQNASFPCTK